MVLLIRRPVSEHDPRYSAAAATINGLPLELPAARQRLGLTVAVHAQQIGLAASTLRDLESGATTEPRKSTIIACLLWLAAN